MTETQVLYIDTDISLGTPGAEIDDGAALMMLLKSAAVRIAGIGSVFGNVPVEDAAANLARLVAFFGRADIPLGVGADHPLAGNLDWFNEWRAGYGKTPPFEGRLPDIAACDLLIDCVHRHPGKISILALGPLTNLALAIEKITGNFR